MDEMIQRGKESLKRRKWAQSDTELLSRVMIRIKDWASTSPQAATRDVVGSTAKQMIETLSGRNVLTDDVKVKVHNMPLLVQWEYGRSTPWEYTLWELKVLFSNYSNSNKTIFLNAIQIEFTEFIDNRVYSVSEREFYSETWFVISISDYLKQPNSLKVATYSGI